MRIEQYKEASPMLVAVDCIIFGFDGNQLKALLIKRDFEPKKGKWSLMGGFVDRNESVRDAAYRVLGQLTGLTNLYMEQIGCFGDVDRDPGGRVLSVAYFALIKIEEHDETAKNEYNSHWHNLNEIPKLIFDHDSMVKLAKEKLREKVASHPVGFSLLPLKFTLQQLQSLYEGIFEKQLDKRNFTRKILDLNILKKLNEKDKKGSRKGAFYYTFDKKKYDTLEKGRLRFG